MVQNPQNSRFSFKRSCLQRVYDTECRYSCDRHLSMKEHIGTQSWDGLYHENLKIAHSVTSYLLYDVIT
jgi:hypothetical protein